MKDAKGHGSEKRGAAGGQLSPGTRVVQTMGIRQSGVTTKPFDWKQSNDGTYKAPGPNDHPVQWDDGTKGYINSVHIAPSGSNAARPARDPTPMELAAQHGISTAHLGTPEYQAGLLRDAHSLGASMKAKGQPRASLPGASSELKDAYMKGYRGK